MCHERSYKLFRCLDLAKASIHVSQYVSPIPGYLSMLLLLAVYVIDRDHQMRVMCNKKHGSKGEKGCKPSNEKTSPT